MLKDGVNDTLLVEGAPFTGDGEYRIGSKLFHAAVKECGSAVCGLVCIAVTDSDLLKGKSDIRTDCGRHYCPLDKTSVINCAVSLRRSSPDELEAGPDVGDGADLSVDNA